MPPCFELHVVHYQALGLSGGGPWLHPRPQPGPRLALTVPAPAFPSGHLRSSRPHGTFKPPSPDSLVQMPQEGRPGPPFDPCVGDLGGAKQEQRGVRSAGGSDGQVIRRQVRRPLTSGLWWISCFLGPYVSLHASFPLSPSGTIRPHLGVSFAPVRWGQASHQFHPRLWLSLSLGQ